MACPPSIVTPAKSEQTSTEFVPVPKQAEMPESLMRLATAVSVLPMSKGLTPNGSTSLIVTANME